MVLGGIPDGVADRYCYEFKSPSGGDTSVVDNRKMAARQAELYAFAFKRPEIRIQLVRFQRPGPFPFAVRELKMLEVMPPIARVASTREALGILERMDQSLAG